MGQTYEEFKGSVVSVREILDTCLQKVTVLGNGWATAICPFHNDNNPSFSINCSSGNWKCFGCKKTGSFFEIPHVPAQPLPVAVYPYCDQGAVAFFKVRYFPKTFKQFSLDEGLVVPGKRTAKSLLYNLENINGSPEVYLVEGEKNVETLKGLRLSAVTGGSSADWTPEHAKALANRKVTVIPDNDEAGEKWLKLVTSTLTPAKILTIPDETISDVTEWIQKDFSIDRLKEVELAEIPKSYEILDVSQADEPGPRECLWGPYLPKNHIALIFGDGGNGKSLFSMMLCYYMALGRDFLGISTPKTKSLFLDWELNEEEYTRRAYQISRGLGLPRPPQGVFYHFAKGGLKSTIERVAAEVKAHGIEFLVVDSLGPATGGDVMDPKEVIKAFLELKDLGLTILLIDHEAKPQNAANGTPNQNMKPYGSVYKHNLSRSVLKIEKREELSTAGVFKLTQFKNNFSKLAAPAYFTLEFGEKDVKWVK